MRKILLINPPETEQTGFISPPLGLASLAGTLQAAGFGVRIVDGCRTGWAGVKAELETCRPDLVGITCLTPGRKKALACARLAREILGQCTVVLGGAHPTLMYRQLLENYPEVDLVVVGEGELALLEIARGEPPEKIAGVASRGPGGAVVFTERRPVEDLDSLPLPAWQLLGPELLKYPPNSPIPSHNGIDLAAVPRVSVVFSRGCTGRCEFCSTWRVWKGWRGRSPGRMADELELLYKDFGIRHFCFADDAMTVDRGAAIGLCDEIIRRGLKIAFYATTRADCVDPELLARLKAAGCYEVSFGIESASPELLRRMNKKADVETALAAIKMTRAAGLRACALLIAGNAGETAATIDETVDFLRRAEPDGIGTAGGLWVLPGTALCERLKRKGVLDDGFWLGDEPYLLYTMEHPPRRLRLFAHAIKTRKKISEMSAGYKARFYAAELASAAGRRLETFPAAKAALKALLGPALRALRSGGGN